MDTGVHLGMGLHPVTRVADAALTAIFGPSWPSDVVGWAGEIAEDVAEAIEDAVIEHIGGEPFMRMDRGQSNRYNADLCEAGQDEWCR